MSYSDRFVKFPATLELKSDLGLETEDFESYIKINLLEVAYYFPECGEETKMTIITMKSGKSISVNLTVEEFEKIANDHLK